jgi:hypothetical protein
MLDVALVTYRDRSQLDLRLDADQPALLAALRARGLHAEAWGWDDPAVDWSKARIAVVRSTWNYYRVYADFVRWIGAAGARTRLENPPAVLLKNSRKTYLGELAAAGVPTVPTVFVGAEARLDLPALGALLGERGWERAVIKPQVSAGSYKTYAFDRAELAAAPASPRSAAIAELLASPEHELMVQPFVGSVLDYGERCLIFIDGECTHAVRKAARFADGGEFASSIVEPAADELRCARGVLEALGAGCKGLLYARVDLARDEAGRPLLMELELIEPYLFLGSAPHAAERFADAIAARVSS